MTALQVNGLSASHRDGSAIHDVTFSVERHAATAVLGRNGSGKSTLMAAIAGLIPATAGSVSVGGADVTSRPADWRARTGLALVPERRRLFPTLSVEENLRLGAFHAAPEEQDERIAAMTELFPILAERLA